MLSLLLAVYRFFYYHGPTIWFGGNTVPIVNLLNTNGTISTRLGSASSHGMLRSLVHLREGLQDGVQSSGVRTAEEEELLSLC